MGNISLDGRKTHADASKSKVVGYKRLLEIEGQLRQGVGELFEGGEMGEKEDQGDVQMPDGLNMQAEPVIRVTKEIPPVLFARSVGEPLLEKTSKGSIQI